MSIFRNRLEALNPPASRRRWIYVPYDQLCDRIGPLAKISPRDSAVVLIESRDHFNRRPYHRQRIALALANQRHFALEQAARGVHIEYLITEKSIAEALELAAIRHGPLEVMEPAERELREQLRPLVERGLLKMCAHEGWLTTDHDLLGTRENPPWRMDAFYRTVRRRTGILMENGSPVGGRFSFDPQNRLPWKGDPPAPEPPKFPEDEVKKETAQDVLAVFPHHPGTVDVSSIAATLQDARAAWEWAKSACLPFFGPFEDAMSHASSGLFHTRISALINIHRILPREVVEESFALSIPLASKEGFIRQVLGWREFVCRVHRATDGFRALPGGPTKVSGCAGDGGFARWSGRSWPYDSGGFGGACLSVLGADNPLPPAWWGQRSGLACLDSVVEAVWKEGWSHHITRLMVLANIACLLDVDPRELTDWFWAAYTDSYDWVVEPNVLGMGSFAAGDLMTTKPYVAGANYISRMSDFCRICAFDPALNCPLSRLYWAYLARHSDALEDNSRMRTAFTALRRRGAEKLRQDRDTFRRVLELLTAGEALSPAVLER